MKLKHVLMAGTAAFVLAGPAMPAYGQANASSPLLLAQAAPPALIGAITTYREAQAMVEGAEGEENQAEAMAVLQAAEAELGALCAAVGLGSVEECLDMFENGGMEAPQEAPVQTLPAPEIVEDEEPQPEPEMEVIEEQQPEPEAAPEVVDEAEPEIVEEPVQPAPEPEVIEEPAPEPLPETLEEEPAPEPEPAPETMEEEADPGVDMEIETETDAPEIGAGAAAPRPLVAAFEAYEDALIDYQAAISADSGIAEAEQAYIAAEDELADICAAIGFANIDSCLAAFDLTVDIEPVEPPAEVPAEEPAPELEVEPEELRDDVILDGDVLGELLPEGVDQSEIAPLLDSAKDALSESRDPDAEVDASDEEAPAEAVAEVEDEPAPASDEEAQPVIEDVEITSATAEEGTRRETTGGTATTGEPVLIGRVERETPTNLEIITTIGLATVFAIGANQFIDSLDTPRLVEDNFQDYYVEDLPGGRTREVILRPDGSQLITIRDRYGDIVRRSRIEPDGREILLVYVDERYQRYDDQGRWIDPGRDLPPLRLRIPAREYVLDASFADQQRVAGFLQQPPVERLERYYTIDEVKRSSRIRDMVRRLEVGDLTFETNSANIAPDQINSLSAVANAMLDLLDRNPAETFLIEGHTDAVGADLYNLELSDRRAESVAYALTRVYGIPPENLATQGYGKRYLKVNTPLAERLNRRVTIRRITPLITPVANIPAG